MGEQGSRGAGEQGEAADIRDCEEAVVAVNGADAIESTAQPLPDEMQPLPIAGAEPPALPTMLGLWQLTLDWQPTVLQQTQFQQLYALILAGNRQFNLTRITEPTEFWEKHLWDSLRAVTAGLQASGSRELGVGSWESAWAKNLDSPIQGAFKVIDIGTGAGFPGVPIAIAQPIWTITLLDSTRKKINFLDQLLVKLDLANAQTLVERVEQVGRQATHRQTYNLALIRAVAAAPVCAEYALPLLKVGGSAVLYRGQWTDAETTALETAIAILGGAIESIEAFTTPLSHSVRHCIYVKKIAPTPSAFPRAIGVAAQNPL